VEAPVEAVPEPMLYKGPELRLDGSSFRLKR